MKQLGERYETIKRATWDGPRGVLSQSAHWMDAHMTWCWVGLGSVSVCSTPAARPQHARTAPAPRSGGAWRAHLIHMYRSSFHMHRFFFHMHRFFFHMHRFFFPIYIAQLFERGVLCRSLEFQTMVDPSTSSSRSPRPRPHSSPWPNPSPNPSPSLSLSPSATYPSTCAGKFLARFAS